MRSVSLTALHPRIWCEAGIGEMTTSNILFVRTISGEWSVVPVA